MKRPAAPASAEPSALDTRPPKQKPTEVDLGTWNTAKGPVQARMIIRPQHVGTLVRRASESRDGRAQTANGAVVVLTRRVPAAGAVAPVGHPEMKAGERWRLYFRRPGREVDVTVLAIVTDASDPRLPVGAGIALKQDGAVALLDGPPGDRWATPGYIQSVGQRLGNETA